MGNQRISDPQTAEDIKTKEAELRAAEITEKLIDALSLQFLHSMEGLQGKNGQRSLSFPRNRTHQKPLNKCDRLENGRGIV